MPHFAERVARLVEQFHGEGTGTDACAVGFEDAEYFADVRRAYAQSGADAAAGGAGRADEGISAMVDVEHGALRPFGQHAFAFLQVAVDFNLRVGQMEPAHVFHAFQPKFFFFGDVVVRVVQVSQYLFVSCLQGGILFVEMVKDVSHSQADACGLVAICWADALPGGAHFGFAFCGFVGTVQHPVRGQDEVCPFADVQALFQVVSCGFEFFGFGHEQVRRDDTAVSDDVHFVFGEDARGDGAEHEFLAVEDDGVSRVRAAGEAGDHVIIRSEHVHDFSFSFISENDSQQGVDFSFLHNLI